MVAEFLMTLGMFQGSQGLFSEKIPTSHFKLGQAGPGKVFWFRNRQNADMLIKRGPPPKGPLGDMNS